MNIFYNSAERRLRAGWRIVIQVLIFLALQVVFGMVAGLALMLSLMANGKLSNAADLQRVMLNLNNVGVNGLVSLAAIGLSVWAAGRFLDRRPFREFGFHFSETWWRDFGFGLTLGALLMVFIFVVERAAGWVAVTGSGASTRGFGGQIALALVGFLCVGIYEELLSRGYLLRNLAEGFNLKSFNARGALLLAYLLSSAVFGMLHLGNPNANWVSTFNIMLAGLFLGLGFVLTGELAIPIGLHITWNFFQGNVFGFPVSGTNAGASFITIQQGGPVLWTGGSFGPEAGLIGITAILLGALLIWLYVRATSGRADLQDHLAEYRSTSASPSPPPTLDQPEGSGS